MLVRATLWSDPSEVLRRAINNFDGAIVTNMSERVRVSGPAVYAVVLGEAPTGLAAALLATIAGTGQPAYVGSQTGPDCRAGRHRLSIEGARTLTLSEWWTAIVPMRSPEEALAAERLILRWSLPVFNEPRLAGMGSNRQGHQRAAGQAASPWDIAFDTRRPGRSRRTVNDRERAHELHHLIRTFLAGAPSRQPLIDPRRTRSKSVKTRRDFLRTPEAHRALAG